MNASRHTARSIRPGSGETQAGKDRPLAMRHMLAAAQVERAEFERPLAETETRGWT